jgi:hypothetical protein
MTTAADIRIKDIGRTVRSHVYPNKNKTARPKTGIYIDGDGRQRVIRQFEYDIESIYAHSNGNILINGMYYLHADTEVVFQDEYDNGDIND